MQNYKNFSIYHPDGVPSDVLILPEGQPVKVTWLQDDDGNDWYDVQQYFSAETMKLLYDADNVIRCHSMDVTELNPINMSVAEVAVVDIPEAAVGTLTEGGWCYVDGIVQLRVYTPDEILQKVQEVKAELLKDAESIIFPLTLAVKHGMATEEETASLEAWEKYSVLVSRVKPGEDWPLKPE